MRRLVAISMKTLLTILFVFFTSVEVFAQGKIEFWNDSLHLCYYPTDFPPGFAGQAVDSAHMLPGMTLVADLYIGTASSSLSLITSTTFGANPGRWNSANVTVPGIPGGTSVFVVVQIRDDRSPPSAQWTIQGGWGNSQEFPFILGAGITYPTLWSQGTWPIGTFNMDQYGVGARGAIAFGVPEPSSVALAGLGGALLFLRKPLISKHFKGFQRKLSRTAF
jgi:hypothetical protein